MTDFVEVAPRVWVARYDWLDVNVTVVGGDRGLLVVDTLGSEAAARTLLDDVRRLAGAGAEVVGLVNTHEHFDHVFGNGVLREAFPTSPIYAHEWAARHTVAAAELLKDRYAANRDASYRAEVLATRVVPADHPVSSASALDLGDRLVELVHPGRGHTSGDLVVRVPDARVLLAGDLVEESGPPSMGGDSCPLEWPATLDLVLQLVGPDDVVVPGHGAPVDRDFVDDQRDGLVRIAETIRDLHDRGVPVEEAIEAADWPWDPDRIRDGLHRAYDQLPRVPRQLPLA